MSSSDPHAGFGGQPRVVAGFGGQPRVVAGRVVAAMVVALVAAATGSSFPAAAATAAGPTAASPALLFGWPLPGRPPVLRRFEPPPDRFAPGHRGVDLGAPIGTPVRAAGTGVVGYAGPVAGRGVVTVFHAGGLRSTYEPVTATAGPGTPVARGQQIGWLAAPTGHCGPGTSCLHWGVRRGSTYLDPLSLLGVAPVRLFPPGGQPLGNGTTAPDPPPAATAGAATVDGLATGAARTAVPSPRAPAEPAASAPAAPAGPGPPAPPAPPAASAPAASAERGAGTSVPPLVPLAGVAVTAAAALALARGRG